MTGIKILKDSENQIVHDWLRTMGMSVNRLLNREYADGFLIARLLKKMYPQLVNIHAYQRSYSYDVKTTNWRTLNFKVLRRIGLSLTDQEVESLVRGEPGSIEQLMWVLMNFSVDGRNFKLRAKRRKSPYTKKLTKRKSIIKRENTFEPTTQRLRAAPQALVLNVERQEEDSSTEGDTSQTNTSREPSLWELPLTEMFFQTAPMPASSVTSWEALTKTVATTVPQQTFSEQTASDNFSNPSNANMFTTTSSATTSSHYEGLNSSITAANAAVHNYEMELENAKNRVKELEALLKQQDEILEMLRERANVYDNESREFHDMIAKVKANSR